MEKVKVEWVLTSERRPTPFIPVIGAYPFSYKTFFKVVEYLGGEATQPWSSDLGAVAPPKYWIPIPLFNE